MRRGAGIFVQPGRSGAERERFVAIAAAPHPASGHPLPASRGEGYLSRELRKDQVPFSPLAGRRCREAADEGARPRYSCLMHVLLFLAASLLAQPDLFTVRTFHQVAIS